MVNVICALGHVPWEQQFINSLGHPMFGVSVTKRCVDGIDILAAVRTIDVDAVVVSHVRLLYAVLLLHGPARPLKGVPPHVTASRFDCPAVGSWRGSAL